MAISLMINAGIFSVVVNKIRKVKGAVSKINTSGRKDDTTEQYNHRIKILILIAYFTNTLEEYIQN